MKYDLAVTTIRGLAALVVLAALGCGNSKPAVSGIVSVTLHQSGKPDSSPMPWFGGSDIAFDAPPGGAQGFFGVCTHASSTWTTEIHRAGTITPAIRAMRLTMEDGTAQASIALTLDEGTFAGGCLVAASRWNDSHDLRLAGDCTGLTAQNDPHTADASLVMSVTNCTGP